MPGPDSLEATKFSNLSELPYGAHVEALQFASICSCPGHLRFVYLPDDCEHRCHRAVKINLRCPRSNFGALLGISCLLLGRFWGGQGWREGRGGCQEEALLLSLVFLGENKDGRWLERNFQEAPFPPDPLQCFALRATEERLIVLNAMDHLKELCYIVKSFDIHILEKSEN